MLNKDFEFGGKTGVSGTSGNWAGEANVSGGVNGNAKMNVSLSKIEAELSAQLGAKMAAEGRYG